MIGLIPLLVLAASGATPPTADPLQIKAQLEAAHSAEELNAVLKQQALIGDMTPGDVSNLGKLKVDLFRANLFGTPEKEVVLQLRFDQKYYVLAFYEKAPGGWRRVPGEWAEDGTLQEWCDPKTPPCNGYFCFSFEELRQPGEASIVGHRYGGHCSGSGRFSEEDVVAFQVTSKGPLRLADILVSRHDYHSPDGEVIFSQSGSASFQPSGATPFPKVLAIDGAVDHPRQDEPLVSLILGTDSSAPANAAGPQSPLGVRNVVRLEFSSEP